MTIKTKMETAIESKFIGNKLRKRRMQIGFSQSKLGKLENITFQQIQKYESGKNRIYSGRLWRFAKILHVNVFYFFNGLDEAMETYKKISNKNVPNVVKLRNLNTRMNKFDIEINELSKSFLKIKNEKSRKSIVKLTKKLVENEKKTE